MGGWKMAIIKNKETSLDKKNNRDLFLEIIAAVICISSIAIFIKTHNIYITVVIFIVAFFAALHLHKQRKIYKFGITGEKAVAKLLSQLDNNYIVYNDIIIGGKEKGAQIDHLVLSPYGLFCIETKSMKGTINGREDDKYWTQKKTGKGGNTYEKEFYNPCKQSVGHVNAVKYLLKHKDFQNIWVQSVVVFSSEENVRLNLQIERTPVMKADKLLEYFHYRKEIIINKDKLKRIEAVIDRGLV